MDYFNKIFERANIKQLRSFLLCKSEDFNDFSKTAEIRKTYAHRVNQALKETENFISKKYPEENEKE